MASHSSILAWKTPWIEEPGGLQSTGCKEQDMIERLSTIVGTGRVFSLRLKTPREQGFLCVFAFQVQSI